MLATQQGRACWELQKISCSCNRSNREIVVACMANLGAAALPLIGKDCQGVGADRSCWTCLTWDGEIDLE
jgi:hypothetical protein